MRVVLDTNILVAALITKGTPPDQIYQSWLRGELEVVTSVVQMHELTDVLSRPRLQRYIDAGEATAIVENLDTRAVMLDRLPHVNLSADPKDDPILATAIAGKADLLITGDKRDLLVLTEAQGIPIVTARDALVQLRKRLPPR